MSIKKVMFGQYGNDVIYSYILENDNGMLVEILNLGGIIRRLVYNNIDVCLGYDTLSEYLDNEEYFGALIGRNTNLIENSEFVLNEKLYKLSNNCGRHNHHGGNVGFSKKVWNAKTTDADKTSLVLSLISPDGDEGFPGNVDINVTYTLTKDNSLRIHYSGESDADTVLNMTNHTYFNLNGHASGSICSHALWLNSDFYTPNTDDGLPNGEIISVKGTPLDFSSENVINTRLQDSYEQISKFSGIDHNFVLKESNFRKVGMLKADKTGISMEIYTDRPGIQVYTANELSGDKVCKAGAIYNKHCGICFETQDFPNNLRYPHFPSSILKKNKKYETTTLFRFT